MEHQGCAVFFHFDMTSMSSIILSFSLPCWYLRKLWCDAWNETRNVIRWQKPIYLIHVYWRTCSITNLFLIKYCWGCRLDQTLDCRSQCLVAQLAVFPASIVDYSYFLSETTHWLLMQVINLSPWFEKPLMCISKILIFQQLMHCRESFVVEKCKFLQCLVLCLRDKLSFPHQSIEEFLSFYT